MKKIIFTFLFSTALYVFSFSQNVVDSLTKKISSNCGHTIIPPSVYNALTLISANFNNFEYLMKTNNYEYNATEDSYWAKSGAGCNFYVINKKYDIVNFFWTGDKKLINELYDELKLNNIKLFYKGDSQIATLILEGMKYELSIQDLGNGSGGFVFQEKGLANHEVDNFKKSSKPYTSTSKKTGNDLNTPSNSEIINNWLSENINSDYKISESVLKKANFKSVSNYLTKIPENVKSIFTSEAEPLKGLTPKIEVSEFSITLQFPLSCLCKFFLLEDKIIYTSNGCGSSSNTQIFEFSNKKLNATPFAIFKIVNGVADITKDWFEETGGHYYRDGKLNLITNKIVWEKVE